MDLAGILFWWSCSWRFWRDYSVLPHSILNSDPPHVLQVHPLQREAVQVSGVREGLLSVQDSGRPQDVTHAGEGTQAQQDQIIQLHQRGRVIGRTGTLEKQRAKTTAVTVQLLLSFCLHLSGWRWSTSASLGILPPGGNISLAGPKNSSQTSGSA